MVVVACMKIIGLICRFSDEFNFEFDFHVQL